ncbi:hypothetical protein BDP81DRAFT_455808 [Colletotrichum phormii]|uniref:Uncharacterized protein n=1 Tax=Colletotrichum phormii TaxID=359342 RepID=A0AAI9ZCH7_9PEZI|nr:uncharacterized protein BDP81DRAFT_455808 [Colletotrichum phormii]KAK1621968.1 hypothetical protein BDP81DRAFT_455808 [Colletotrichum phormii]
MAFALRYPSFDMIQLYHERNHRYRTYKRQNEKGLPWIETLKMHEMGDWMAFTLKEQAFGRLEAFCVLLREARHQAIWEKFQKSKLTAEILEEYFQRHRNLDHFVSMIRLYHSNLVFQIAATLLDEDNPDPESAASMKNTVRRIKDVFLMWKPINEMEEIPEAAKKYQIEIPKFNDIEAWNREKEVLDGVLGTQDAYAQKELKMCREFEKKRAVHDQRHSDTQREAEERKQEQQQST